MKWSKTSLALVLLPTLPLILYGIPYSQAASSSDYLVTGILTVTAGGLGHGHVDCTGNNDYAISGGYIPGLESAPTAPYGFPIIIASYPTASGVAAGAGQTPNGWGFDAANPTGDTQNAKIYAVCQTPITVAGIGVPEFGSMYVAIAFGAMLFVVLSRNYSKTKQINSV